LAGRQERTRVGRGAVWIRRLSEVELVCPVA